MKLTTRTPTPCLFLWKWPLIPRQLPGLRDSCKEPYMQGGKYLRPIHGRMYFRSFIMNTTGGGFLWSILNSGSQSSPTISSNIMVSGLLLIARILDWVVRAIFLGLGLLWTWSGLFFPWSNVMEHSFGPFNRDLVCKLI